MLNLRDHREPRDWHRPWRDPPGFFWPNCPCCGTGGLLVVISTGRNLYAYDGSGAAVWTYDLGQHNAHDYVGGKILVDSAGNTYVPYHESAVNNADSGLVKIDITGALVWDYNVGTTFAVSTNTIRELVGGVCFDSSGNVIFATGLHGNGTTYDYAFKVDTSGSLLTTYSTHSTGFPAGSQDALRFNGANASVVDAIAVDASDNLYWIDPSNHNILFKVDSSGTYQASVTISGLNGTTSGEFGRSMCADTVNGKLFIGFSANKIASYDTATYLAGKWDCAAMTNDWVFDLTNWNTTIEDLTNSVFTNLGGIINACGRNLGYDPNSLRVYVGGGYLVDNGGTPAVIEQFFSMSSGATPAIGWSGVVQSTAHAVKGIGACVDPTTGDVFGIAESSGAGGGNTIDALWRLDASNGSVIWHVNTAHSPIAIGCGSWS